MKNLEVSRRMKFGVEIEIMAIDTVSTNRMNTLEVIAEAIKAEGVNVNAESLSHAVRGYWKVVTDSSCGYEVVSPVLYNFDDLKKVCLALKKIGAKVDKTCGLHVHHDASDMNLEKIKNVYRLYNKHQEVLDGLMPESRRNNRFAKEIDAYFLSRVERQTSIGSMKQEIGGENEGHYTSRRYYKVNFASYVCYGTVEFRQHSGTIDFEKISNWVLITHMIMERANMRCNIRKYENYDEIKNANQLVSRFLKEVCISGTEVADYVCKRTRQMKKDERNERVA